MPLGRSNPATSGFGPNAWLVDDMYEQYRRAPDSVSPSWREFFEDRAASIGDNREVVPAQPVENGAPKKAPVAVALPVTAASGEAVAGAQVLRGPGARVVANMEASLGVPTATSVRRIPAKLLEVNRSVINDHLARSRGGKVSFTHLIAYAVLQALHRVPNMNACFVPDADGKGSPGVLHRPQVGLGIAIDLVRSDGSRNLMVPCIANADGLDFHSFLLAYEELVRRARTGRLGADDLAGTTITITNPGTLGTEHSVPRLLAGQGAIIGVGAIDWPAELRAADVGRLAELGVSKVVTITSTYDHRIIQGAESGVFLARVEELLRGEDAFYDEIFHSLAVPYEPARWGRDSNPVDSERSRLLKQTHVQSLINMYRVRGHLMADLDPLGMRVPHMHSELDPASYGLTVWDLDRDFLTDGLAGRDVLALGTTLEVLRDAYCRTVGLEYMHIQEPDQKRWIQSQVEGKSPRVAPDEQREILERLNAAEAFERFLHTRYVGQKRFGLEGAESAIVLLWSVLDEAVATGMSEAVLGMAHRGRLNVLANIVGKSYGEIFREFEGDLDPDSVQGSGDVKYHKGASGTFVSRNGTELPLTLASNPSHLEAVDPVVEGMARARQDLIGDGKFPVLSVLVHGDAAFAGQGVVAETLNLSGLRGYRTGGAIHIVINNQLGFTTAPEEARTSVYPTDVAKMVQAPIFHVNGDDPEACARVGRLAVAFRQEFHKDVVIDMVCYRRFGHNEGDEPSYTQPQMYSRIQRKRSVRKLYTEALINRGDLTLEEAERALEDFSAKLQSALDQTRSHVSPPAVLPPPPPPPPQAVPMGTGVERPVLDRIAGVLHSVPEGFTVHPKLARQFETRAADYADGEVDWALGEALAIGSLLLEGTEVRLAGQDTRRGTFSQRHAALVDYLTGEEWVPLAELAGGAGGAPPPAPGAPGRFFIYDSLLSEYAAVGFEYGYSVIRPDALVAWEAQFGDFVNGAQIIIDEFVVAAGDKWGQHSGLVLLLPHGYEGQGPDHSSARIERFLTLAAGNNLAIAYPTTAAQYFHLLRYQVRGNGQHPLVVFTPKSLLRAKAARSRVDELVNGSFRAVLDDPSETLDPESVRRLILCTGKVSYEALARRDALLAEGEETTVSAIARVEQLYPWPHGDIDNLLNRYSRAEEVLWLQEEPENMGAWSYVRGMLGDQLRGGPELWHVSRAPSGSPATGSHALSQLESEDLLQHAFGKH